MQSLLCLLTVAVIVAAGIDGSQAQLLANLKNFVNTIPTFSSNNNPTFAVQDGKVDVNVPVPQNVHFGQVDPQTGTWELTDKSLGAGVAVGPHGAQLLTATPSTGDTKFQQAAALGPNGLTIGPNKVDTPYSEQARQDQGNWGIQNLKIGKDGLIVNDGSRLNSSVQVDPQGIQLNGNPTGGGESHLFIKPNINLLGQQFGQAAPPKEPNNVQVSYGDGKTTATEQLKGYTNYALNPNKGTYAQVPNQAPPFMGVNPNGKYTSYAAQAPAPFGAGMAATQAPAWQQESTTQSGGASSGYAFAPAPTQKYRVVQTPNPRRFEYTGDIASGSPQAAAAYAKQIGGNVQQIQQQMDQRQEVFSQLQDRLNAENAAQDDAARVPVAVPVPPPAYQDRGFQKLAGMSDGSKLAVAADLSNSGVNSFASQDGYAPDQAPQLYSAYAPGPGEQGDLDLESFLKGKKKKKDHAPAPAPSHAHHKKNESSPAPGPEHKHKNNETSPAPAPGPEHKHKKNETSPAPAPGPGHKHKKDATETPTAEIGQAHALDGEAASPTLSPGEVTSAAQQEMHFSGGGKPQNAVPAPLYAGGNPPSMMASPVPSNGSNNSPSPYPSNTAAYIHGLLNDKMNVEVVGQNFLATSPIAGVPEPDFVDVAAPVQAPAQAAAPSSSPAQAPASATGQKPVGAQMVALDAYQSSIVTSTASAPVQAPMATSKQAISAPAPAPVQAPVAALKQAINAPAPTPVQAPVAALKQAINAPAPTPVQAPMAAPKQAVNAPAPAPGQAPVAAPKQAVSAPARAPVQAPVAAPKQAVSMVAPASAQAAAAVPQQASSAPTPAATQAIVAATQQAVKTPVPTAVQAPIVVLKQTVSTPAPAPVQAPQQAASAPAPIQAPVPAPKQAVSAPASAPVQAAPLAALANASQVPALALTAAQDPAATSKAPAALPTAAQEPTAASKAPAALPTAVQEPVATSKAPASAPAAAQVSAAAQEPVAASKAAAAGLQPAAPQTLSNQAAAQSPQDRFLEALAIVKQQYAAGTISAAGGLKTKASAPAPGTAAQTLGRRLLGM